MSNTTFLSILKKLSPDFGILSESFNLQTMKFSENPEDKAKEQAAAEKTIHGQIDKTEKLDEVDTVTFGLETDDNKIVKVYVDAEQANDFEKELSNKLGEIDDIEEILNELSKKFNIIDVEWPDDKTKDPTDDNDEPDGSESMDPRVYKKDQTVEEDGVTENLSYGSRVSLSLIENLSSIEQRLITPSQLLVYHAILQLGVPEIALVKSPYRSSIIQGVKDVAIEMNNNSQLKIALKNFVKYAVIDDNSKTPDKDSEKENSKKDPKPEHKPEHKPEPKPEPKNSKENIKESIDAGDDFWNSVKSILKHVMTNEMQLDRLINCSPWKQLVSRSTARLGSTFVGVLPKKMADIVSQLPPANSSEQMDESISADDFNSLLNILFEFADPTPDKKYATNLMNSQQMKQFNTSVKAALSQKFPSSIRPRLNILLNLFITKTQNGDTVPETQIIEAVQIDKGKWNFESVDKNLKITHGDHLSILLDAENMEHLAKGVSSKRAVVVKDTDGKKFTFSPRGIMMKVSETGSKQVCEMYAKDINNLLESINESTKSK